MIRNICIKEEKSGLVAKFRLLSGEAPVNSEFLWQIAGANTVVEGLHAMWTGPEISCPLVGSRIPRDIKLVDLPLENATMFPDQGDLALAFAPDGRWKAVSGGPVYDIGLFYGKGGRLLMPFGWIAASICAQVLPEYSDHLKQCCESIRRHGVCNVVISR